MLLPIYKGKALRTRLGTSFTETQEKGHFSFLFFFSGGERGGGGGDEGLIMGGGVGAQKERKILHNSDLQRLAF